MTNSAIAPATSPDPDLRRSSPGTSWDSGSNVSPGLSRLRAGLCRYADGAAGAPQIASITVGGQTVTGSTFANNTSSTTRTHVQYHGSGRRRHGFGLHGRRHHAHRHGNGFLGGHDHHGDHQRHDQDRRRQPQSSPSSRRRPKRRSIPISPSVRRAVTARAAEYSVPASSINSAASAGTTLSIGLLVLAQPASSAQVGVPYTYTVQTNAPSGDTVTVTPVTLPAGMQFNGANTFTWTPTNAQVNTAPDVRAPRSPTPTATRPRSVRSDISVILGLAPVEVPVNTTSGGNVTVSFSGNQVEVYDNIAKAVLSKATFKSTDADHDRFARRPGEQRVDRAPQQRQRRDSEGDAGPGATAARRTTRSPWLGRAGPTRSPLAGSTVTANGLATQLTDVQKLTLNGRRRQQLLHAQFQQPCPPAIVDAGGYNTLDFSHDTAGVNVNLGLDKGQAQSIAPWNTTLVDLRRDQQADRLGTMPTSSPAARRRRRRSSAGRATIRSPAAAATTSSWAAAATTRSSAARAGI